MRRKGVYAGWANAGRHRVWVRVPEELADRAHAGGNGHENGDGPPPIVLVHGIGASGRAMGPLLRALGDSRSVFAPDLPGFGLSEAPAGPLAVADLADGLRRWMIGHGIAPAVLLATSSGCQIAIDLAARHPALVDRLVLVSPTRPNGATGRRVALRWARHASPSLIKDTLDAGPWRSASSLRSALADPVEGKLPDVEAPTLVVRGERDKLVSEEWAARIAELLPDADVAQIEHGEGTPANGAVAQLVLRVEEFLASERAPRADPVEAPGTEASSESARRWIVDGMNVIGSRPDGWWRDRPRAWRRIARELERFAKQNGEQVQLVLDGRRPSSWEDEGLVETSFAGTGPGAGDDAIVARVAADPDPELVRVVTSDRELAERVGDLGAEVVPSQVLRQALDESAPAESRGA